MTIGDTTPVAGPRYRMLALDLDGTLLSPDGSVSEANRRAVRAARDAGILVTICTGRGLLESEHALRAIEQSEPVIVAGGSMIACPRTRRTIHRFGISDELVRRTVGVIVESGHPALVLKDPLDAGYDYLVVRGPEELPLDPVTLWWFEKMRVKVRHVRSIDEDEHPEHTVRVGACGLASVLSRVEERLVTDIEHDMTMHNFPAVVAPEYAKRLPTGEMLHILEIFDKSAHKWSAIAHLAAKHGIDAEHIACIGDEVNDVTMISGAGLGIAMGNAVPAVARAARRQTRSNAEDGVAHAVGMMLSGAW
jgi:hydroxymethylpyrimidine pyrophosphatase-like HAD family hydrolase